MENDTTYFQKFYKEKPDIIEKHEGKKTKYFLFLKKTIEEEIIASNYEAKDLFSKTGSNIFPKIASTFSFSR